MDERSGGVADAVAAEPPDEGAAADAVGGEPALEAGHDAAEPAPGTAQDALAARFDAARERLRATIKPPPPDDG